MELEIEVFYHSSETLQKKDTGVPYSILECDTRMVTFYHIDYIAPYADEESGQWVCDICSGGFSHTSTKTYEEIKKMIHEAHERERSY